MSAARIALFLLLAAAGARCGETLLYPHPGGPSGPAASDGWDLIAESGEGYRDFTGGRARLRLPARPNRRIRIRFVATYTAKMNLHAIPLDGKATLPLIPLSGQWDYAHARSDPETVHLAFVTPETADAFFFTLASTGRVTVEDLRIADLGSAPEYEVTGQELLSDPGWEDVPERARIPPENSYHRTLNGWMAWANARADAHAVTPVPARVRSGRQAVMVVASQAGIREGFRRRPVPLDPERAYRFSVWAKGHGTFAIHNVNYSSSPAFAVSPDEWRLFNFCFTTDNPSARSPSLGLYVNGRLYFDDFSLKMVSRAEVPSLMAANEPYLAARLPARVPQRVPEGETRSRDPVVLENERVRAELSPVGGGRVVAFDDKSLATGAARDSGLLAMDFATQPAPLDWDLPFAAALHEEGRAVTFTHTVTGESAAPFLDGLRIEQTFRLPAGSRLLEVHWRLVNTASGLRLPEPLVHNRWAPFPGQPVLAAYASKWPPGFILQAVKGDAGLHHTAEASLLLQQPIAGWMAAGLAKHSLVFGFDAQTVRSVRLEPAHHRLSWQYPRLALPPGGSWEDRGFLAATALDAVCYADRNTAVKAQVSIPGAAGDPFHMDFAADAFADGTRVTARITDYQGREIARIGPEAGGLAFHPPPGNFVTVLDVVTPDHAYSMELFNDPPQREEGIGIHGAGQTQYAPSIPVRVLRLPDAGDLRAEIAQGDTVFWCYGLYSHLYPLRDVLAGAGLDVKILSNGGGFPEELDELRACPLVIVSNLGAADLSAHARAALAQYVRGGGKLLVTGGTRGLGNANTLRSDLGEMLPAELHGPFDCLPAPPDANRLTPVPGAGLDNLPWNEQPRIYWQHSVTPRPGAAVLAAVGERPALLIAPHGRGRVMLFTGTVEGQAKPGETAAWEWSGWTNFWAGALDILDADGGAP